MKTKDDRRPHGARQSEGGQGQTKPCRGRMDGWGYETERQVEDVEFLSR